ncbi:hypothetical protein ANCDUO_00877 [Ancylostoma duodenale]|uniref:Uncharacterized protein n=1 Tax=Ancylostoma duodenale TaxID=51022 RepID=A0A0C2H4Q7_9BILA|nr:hypothetical protein ANCDUO_00877 [Ancylostoma duodenale]
MRNAAAYTKFSKIRWAGHVTTTVEREPSATELRGTLNAQQEDYRPDGQTTLQRPSRKDTMLFVPSSRQNLLDDSGTREGQMEGLLALAQYIRRSTGVKVIKVIKLTVRPK